MEATYFARVLKYIHAYLYVKCFEITRNHAMDNLFKAIMVTVIAGVILLHLQYNFFETQHVQPQAPESPYQQTPTNFIFSYFADISMGDVNSVISKWKFPNEKRLRSMVTGDSNCNVNKAEELLDSSSDTATVFTEVTCERRWIGTIKLEMVGTEWKITKFNLREVL